MLPPTRDLDFIVLAREPEAKEFVVILPNKDTYAMEFEEMNVYLKLLGVPLDKDITGYVYNFYGAHLDLTNMHMTPLSHEQAMAYGEIKQ